MNTIVKSAVAGVLALGASSAFAAYTAPQTDSSDLVLVVQNNSTQATYVLDTGISVSSVLPGTGSYVAGASLSTALPQINATIPESSTLSSFLSSPAATGFSYTIDGATYSPYGSSTTASTSRNRTAGLLDGVFTSMGATTTPSNLANATLANGVNYVNGINLEVSSGAFQPLLTAPESTSGAAYDSGAQQKFGLFSSNDLAALGSAVGLFGVTGDGSSTALETYVLGSVTLSSAGVLTINNGAVSSVPLPAAVWLFGSGLMGLVGVSRRRKTAVSV